MKVKKNKSSKFWVLIGVFSVMILISLTISLAWFTKNKEEEDFVLNFNNVEIKLNGQNSENIDFFVKGREEEVKKIIMPGDTVCCNIKVTNIGDCACFYIVNLKCDKINIDKDFYFDTSTKISNSQNAEMGMLESGDFHILNLENIIDINYNKQGEKVNFECKVLAIQTRNIEKALAYTELQTLKNSN